MTHDGIEHHATAANAALDVGDFARAVERADAVIDELTRLDGPGSDGVLAWRTFRARALLEGRRYQEAEAEFAGLLVLRERLDGPDTPAVLRIRGHLARAVALGGHPEEALVMAGRLLADRLRLVGEHDSQTLDTRGQIAHFHHLAGHRDTAVELYTDLLGDLTSLLGADDPATVRALEHLAAVRAATRRPTELGELRRRVAELEDEHGPEHDRTLTAMVVLADRLLLVDEWAEAERLARHVESARDRALGPDDPYTVAARSIAVRALGRRGLVADAIIEAAEVVAVVERAGDLDQPEVLGMLADVIECSAAPAFAAGLHAERLLTVWNHLLRGTATLAPDHTLRRVVDTHRDRVERLGGDPRG